MADYMGRKAALLILFALLLQLSFSYAAQICPIDKVQTQINIGHTREPRNLAIGQPENKIAVTIGLTALENGSKSVPLPGSNLSVTVLMPTTGADGKVVETYVLDQQMTTDDVGEVSFEVSTGDFNPRKIKYVISAVYVPEARSIYLGSGKTETYTPGAISPISLAACFPFALVGGLLMAALFAIGKDPFAFFDFSRVAFRPPPVRVKPPKAIRIEPGTLIKGALGTLSAARTLAVGAGKILSGKTPDTIKAYRAGKEAYNKEYSKELAVQAGKQPPKRFALSGLKQEIAAKKKAELSAKMMRRAAIVEADKTAAEAPSSTGLGRGLSNVKTAILGGAVGGALVKAGALIARQYRAGMGKARAEILSGPEGKATEELRGSLAKKLGRPPTREELEAAAMKTKPMHLGGALGEGATLISVSMSYGRAGGASPPNVPKRVSILSARSYVESTVNSLKMLWKMGSYGFTEAGYGNPYVMINDPKFGVLPVHGGALWRPGLLAKTNKDFHLADKNKITSSDLKDSTQVLRKLTDHFAEKFGGDLKKARAEAEKALPQFFRGTVGTKISPVAQQQVQDNFSGIRFFPGWAASKLSKEMPPGMEHVGNSLANNKIGLVVLDSDRRAIDPENKSRDAANKKWKTNLTGSDLNDLPGTYSKLVDALGAEKAQKAIADFYKGSKLTTSDIRSLGSAMTKPETDSQTRLLEYKLGNEKERLGRMQEGLEKMIGTASKYEKEKQQGQIEIQKDTIDGLNYQLKELTTQQASNVEVGVNLAVAIRNLVHQKELDAFKSEKSDVERTKSSATYELTTLEASNRLEDSQKYLKEIDAKIIEIADKISKAAPDEKTKLEQDKHRLETIDKPIYGKEIDRIATRQAELNQTIHTSDDKLKVLDSEIQTREKMIKDTEYAKENIVTTGFAAAAQKTLSENQAKLTTSTSKPTNQCIIESGIDAAYLEPSRNISGYDREHPGYDRNDIRQTENAIAAQRDVLTHFDEREVEGKLGKARYIMENIWLKNNDFKPDDISSESKRKEILASLTQNQKERMTEFTSYVENEARHVISKTRENLQEYSDSLKQVNYVVKVTPDAVKVSVEPKPEQPAAEPRKVAVEPEKAKALGAITLKKVPEEELPQWAKDLETFANAMGNPKEAFSGIDMRELERRRALIEEEMRKGMR